MAMRTKVISREVYAIVSNTEVMQHLRVDDCYDQELLVIYSESATAMAETRTNRMIFPSVVKAFVPEWRNKIFLPYGEVSEIVSVKAKTIATDEDVDVDYSFNDIDESIKLGEINKLNYEFVIEYKCGFESGAVPRQIKQGILIQTASLYRDREDVTHGSKGYVANTTASMLFDSQRIPASR